MSSLILPARSLLKPERAWDLPAAGRPRSRWWRHLLGGRNGLTRLQPGACCGCGGSPVATCAPCNIPEVTLTIAWTFTYTTTNGLTFGPGSTTLPWNSPYPNWDKGCTALGSCSASFQFNCQYLGGALQWYISLWTASTTCTTDVNGDNNGGVSWDNSGVPQPWTLTSYTCSPFAMTWTNSSSETVTVHE